MVRFKVVRASRLLLAAAILLLIAVICVLGYKWFSAVQKPQISSSANLVQADRDESDEAKTTQVFASSEKLLRPAEPESAGIEIEILASPTPIPARAPRVLIYHTHTHEAYEQVSDDPYDALEAWRTTDSGHSVVRVGEELAARLKEAGFDVVHDATDHEGEQLSTAYTRSLATLQRYETPFDLYIDLHRDAYVSGEAICVHGSDGREIAPLMMLIGNGNGFEEKPHYEENLAFAKALEKRVNSIEPGLCKPVLVKDGRYNQHIGVFAILVEVGHNRNTLRQALNAVPPLADGLRSLMIDQPDERLTRMKAKYETSIR